MRIFQFHSFVQNFLLRLQDFSENLFSFFKSGLNLADKGYFFKHILPGVLSALKWLNLELFDNFVRNVIQNYDLMVVFPFVKFFDILCFLLCQISFNVLCVKVHEVYFYWFSKHRERIFNLFPFIFPNGHACHLGCRSVMIYIALVKSQIKAPDDSSWPKLQAVFYYFIDFIAYFISAWLNKVHLWCWL